MKRKVCFSLVVALVFMLGGLFPNKVLAQEIAVKTNILYDATASINAGVEVGLAPSWTVDVSGNFNAWTFSEGRRWKHWLAQPELRYWFCDRFAGHFLAAHGHVGMYSLARTKIIVPFLGESESDAAQHRYEGWFAGAGVGYGYDWILGEHWNLEAELGLGYIYTVYDTYRCVGCGKRVSEDTPRHYWGPTKAALSLIYLF